MLYQIIKELATLIRKNTIWFWSLVSPDIKQGSDFDANYNRYAFSIYRNIY